MTTHIIIGAGLAGAKGAAALRERDADARIVLIGDEGSIPYERPPLSKGYLLGTADRESAFVHPYDWYAEQRIELRTGMRVLEVNRAAKQVVLADGSELDYDKLLLATGSRARSLALPNVTARGVRKLRRIDDADQLKAVLESGRRLVIIGGGWIGLEVAAAARVAGLEVTVLEAEELPLLRVLGREVAQVFADLHREHLVDLRVGAQVRGITAERHRVTGVELADGEVLTTSAVLIAVGAEPNLELAVAAGLEVDNGVLVDESLRTSDPDIYAVGDIARQDHTVLHRRVRVEHWANALNQPAVAAAGMTGTPGSYQELPYFFTDQYDLGMEYVGYVEPGGYDRVVFRGNVSGREFVAFWVQDGRVLAGMAVNTWDVVDDIKELILSGESVDLERLADPAAPLRTLLAGPAVALPRIAPAAAGVDAAGIVAFLDALESTPDVEPHSFMLLRHGAVVAEGWWQPYSAERVHLLYSVSKSFTATALGFAVAEGKVGLDDTVLSYFPELDTEITDSRSRSMLVRHVAAMSSGHAEETYGRAAEIDPVDMLRGFLLIPPDHEPGSVFTYNQPCTLALSAIVQRVSGQSLIDFLRPRLLEPLGINDFAWTRDALDRELGYSGLHATTETVAKLGQLYLQGGRWAGRQLLPAEWVVEATRTHSDTSSYSDPDWRRGYGFQFWQSELGYRADGLHGQYSIVLPEFDAVLAVTGQSPDMQAVLDAVWAHVVPALNRVGSAAADALLTDRIAGLGLPPLEVGRQPAERMTQTFSAAAGNDQPTLTEVTVTSTEPGEWRITLVEGAWRLDAAVGLGNWAISDAVAVSGGWSEAAADGGPIFAADLVFVETPHRLQLRCWTNSSEAGRGTFQSRWVTAPWPAAPLSTVRSPGQSVG